MTGPPSDEKSPAATPAECQVNGEPTERPDDAGEVEVIEPDDTALGRIASAGVAPASRARSHSASNLPPPPDGGLQAWTQVGAGWLVIFATWGYLNSFGSFQSYYTSVLTGQDPSAISWIGSIQAYLTTAVGAFTGRLLDAGLFLPTFTAGAVIQLAGLFAMSASDSPKYWVLMVTQGLMTGLGGGILFTPTIALVATWFKKHRGLAIGLATTGNSAGGIIYPIIVRQLIPRVGFAWTARALGLVNLVCFGVAALLLRSRLPPRRSGALLDLPAFKEGVYSFYVAGLFCFLWANYYAFYYIFLLTSFRIASFAMEHLGLSYSEASKFIMLVNGAGLPARILVPMLADRIGPLNVMTASALSVAVVILAWMGVDSIPGLYAFTTVLGITSGAVQSLMPTIVASITRRLDTVGTRLGMCFSVVSIASLTGPPIGGALQAADGGRFTGAQAWAGVAALLGGVFMMTSRWFQVGWGLKRRC